MGDDEQTGGITRREFVAGTSGLVGGFMVALVGLPAIGYVVAPALGGSSEDEWIPLGPVADLAEGVPTLFTFVTTQVVGWESASSSYGVYVTRLPEDRYDVFSSTCTHLSCRVTWVAEDNEYVCPCHDGRFAKDGAILAGPQPRPLDRYEYRVTDDGILEIHLVEG